MPTDSQGRAILILNRGDKDVELITSLLEKVGLTVLSSSNTDDALQLVSTTDGSARLVVIDDSLPATSVPQFIDRARSLNPALRVLVVSDRDSSEPAPSSAAHSHMRGFLRKPFRRAKFLGSVLNLIHEPMVRTA